MLQGRETLSAPDYIHTMSRAEQSGVNMQMPECSRPTVTRAVLSAS